MTFAGMGSDGISEQTLGGGIPVHVYIVKFSLGLKVLKGFGAEGFWLATHWSATIAYGVYCAREHVPHLQFKKGLWLNKCTWQVCCKSPSNIGQRC